MIQGEFVDIPEFHLTPRHMSQDEIKHFDEIVTRMSEAPAGKGIALELNNRECRRIREVVEKRFPGKKVCFRSISKRPKDGDDEKQAWKQIAFLADGPMSIGRSRPKHIVQQYANMNGLPVDTSIETRQILTNIRDLMERLVNAWEPK